MGKVRMSEVEKMWVPWYRWIYIGCIGYIGYIGYNWKLTALKIARWIYRI